jgi:hypothetical protein
MKVTVLVLTFALATLALAGILPGVFQTPNPNDIFKKVQFRPLQPLDYAGTHHPMQIRPSKLS